MSPRKRVIIVALFVFGVVLIIYALYKVFFQSLGPLTPVTPATQEDIDRAGLPIAGEEPLPDTEPIEPGILRPTTVAPADSGVSPVAAGGLTEVRELLPSNARSVKLRSDGNGINYYNELDNKFYRVTKDGQLNQLSSRKFAAVDKTTWSPSGNHAVLEFPDGSNIFFDFNTQKQATLPKHWEEFTFNANGSQIVSKSIGLDEQNRFLISSDPNGSGASILAHLGTQADKVTPTWSPNGQTVALSETGEPVSAGDGDRQSIYLLSSRQNSVYPQIIVEGWDVKSQWSPSGNQLLYSAYNSKSNYNPHLWVVTTEPGREGSQKIDVGLNTWADKCSFANETTLYCAVPIFLEEGYGLVPALADNIPDEIYKIDLTTGTKTFVATPEDDPTIDSFMVASDESSLFFTDKQNQGLYQMALK